MDTLFASDIDIDRILTGIEAYSGQSVKPGRTLLFFDEVQEIPAVVSALKYFCEDKPELHVVVAGSLLGVLNLSGESFPVGKVDVMHLYPMTFLEYLDASGHERMRMLLASSDRAVINSLGDEYIDLLRQYYFVGGMPEAVKCFVGGGSPLEVRDIQNAILTSYEADFAKHAGDFTQRVRMVWQSIPAQLARENKKFIYGAVRKGGRAAEFENAIQWLVDAGLVYKVCRVAKVWPPLKFYEEKDIFKLFLLDVGLLGAMSGVESAQVLIGDNVFSQYKGAFTENYVMNQLIAADGRPLYYFSKDNSPIEIDFVVQDAGQVFPIEVKAETNVKSKSLRRFVTVDNADSGIRGIRFSMLGFESQDWMVNVPLYAVGSVKLSSI